MAGVTRVGAASEVTTAAGAVVVVTGTVVVVVVVVIFELFVTDLDDSAAASLPARSSTGLVPGVYEIVTVADESTAGAPNKSVTTDPDTETVEIVNAVAPRDTRKSPTAGTLVDLRDSSYVSVILAPDAARTADWRTGAVTSGGVSIPMIAENMGFMSEM